MNYETGLVRDIFNDWNPLQLGFFCYLIKKIQIRGMKFLDLMKLVLWQC